VLKSPSDFQVAIGDPNTKVEARLSTLCTHSSIFGIGSPPLATPDMHNIELGVGIRHRQQGNLLVFRGILLKVRDRQVERGVGRARSLTRARAHAALSAARPTPWRCEPTGAVTATL
jgi:hypothetical protein